MKAKKAEMQNTEAEKSQQEENKILQILCMILMVLCVMAGSGVAAYLYKKDLYQIARIVILSLIMYGMILFSYEQEKIHDQLLFQNQEHGLRYGMIGLLVLVISLLFPLIPAAGWPYPAIFIGLMFFSGKLTAICSGGAFLMISMLLSDQSTPDYFFLYFLSGMAGILLFACLDEAFRVGRAVIVCLMIQLLCICVHEILMTNSPFSLSLLIIPVMNIMISLIILLVLLKYISTAEVYRIRDVYMEINDTEHPLLVQLKEFSKDEYFHAVHTAYLCDRIASKLDMDAQIAKAGGYYHKIGVLKGENSINHIQEVLSPYHFPEDVLIILREYESGTPVHKETVTLMVCDTLVASIRYFFRNSGKDTLDYEKLIQTIFARKMANGTWNNSNITISELEQMKKILVEEKLYYDFLH